MINKLILFASLFFVIISCTPTTNKKEAVETSFDNKYLKTLIIIGDDRSGSTSDIRKLSSDDYKLIFDKIAEWGGGTAGVCLIGNPHPQSREPFILELSHLKNTRSYDPKDPSLTLTKKGLIKTQNEKILRENEVIKDESATKISTFITGILTPNVIDYKPSGKDQTDLDDALMRIDVLINEPTYADFDQIIVAIFSDGIHQPDTGNEKPVSSTINSSKAKIYLIGWERDIQCFKNTEPIKLSSKEAFIQTINNL